MKEEKTEGSLREAMPATAEIVDWLRQQLGRPAADKIVFGGKVGRGTFRSVETGPDGVRREFGSFKPTQWTAKAGSHGA